VLLRDPLAPAPKIAYCRDSERLLNAFAEAVTEIMLLQEQQFLAVIKGDADIGRFDLLIHMATEKKTQAKYAYL
jgi:hypothetical protein